MTHLHCVEDAAEVGFFRLSLQESMAARACSASLMKTLQHPSGHGVGNGLFGPVRLASGWHPANRSDMEAFDFKCWAIRSMVRSCRPTTKCA